MRWERIPDNSRVGLVVDQPTGDPVDAECEAAATDAARLLEALGHHVDVMTGSMLANDHGLAAVGTVIAASLARDVALWEERLGARVEEMEPMPAAMLELGRSLTAAQLIDAVDRIARWSRSIAAATDSVDVLLTPTMAIIPPELGVLSGTGSDTGMLSSLSAMVSFAIPFDVSGQPAISLPLSWTPEGLPVGVQLVAHYGREDVLFRLASQIEDAQPWADRHPDSANSLNPPDPQGEGRQRQSRHEAPYYCRDGRASGAD